METKLSFRVYTVQCTRLIASAYLEEDGLISKEKNVLHKTEIILDLM